MKKHRTLGHQTLQTRAILGHRRFFFAEPTEVQKLRKYRDVLCRLEQSRPAVTGRPMFVFVWVSRSNDLNSGAVGTGECSVARRVVVRHGACWPSLSGAQKSVFEGTAAIINV